MKTRVFVLRFMLVAALSLVLLGLVLRPYTHLLSYVVRTAVNCLTPLEVTGTGIDGNWFKTTLTFLYDGRSTEPPLPAGFVAINWAAFVALVGATPGLGWRRTARALSVGCAIFFVWHVVHLSTLVVMVVAMHLTAPTRSVYLLATVSFVLPFFTWLFLTRPPQIFQYFKGAQQDGGSVEQS
jgi:hypothetical protein